MNNKEEISVQNRFHTANELPQIVTEIKLQCTIAPDLVQYDHPSRGPHIASCTQHSRRPKVTCHHECSVHPIIGCPLDRQRQDPPR
ncbi:hypothetical protein AVEN_55972-1 [Araneus ventricosus]|uniref:Uncharacterized protein n=1 Tax=Araneus ventricosus TaxID=182803 RepID=A0A4Y2GRF0_ARAVE|nr:hypothetical protein AVEN_55972-1 [Araneus ventricosus]